MVIKENIFVFTKCALKFLVSTKNIMSILHHTHFRKKYSEYAYICPYVYLCEYIYRDRWIERGERNFFLNPKTWGYVSPEKMILKNTCKQWGEMLENLPVSNTETECEKTYHTITYFANFIMRREISATNLYQEQHFLTSL